MAKQKYSLVGVNGNAYAIMAYVAESMRECGLDEQEIDEYKEDAQSGNYEHLRNASLEMIEFLNEECCY